MGSLKKQTRFFNVIAPIYNFFYHKQKQNYQRLLKRHFDLSSLPTDAQILDIGCGTGAFLACLAESGYRGTGVDVAAGMLKAARRSTSGLDITFLQEDATKGLSLADKSFDLVITSMVLHGLTADLRQRIYQEASRLSKELIIFFDYDGRRRMLTDIAEWAEGGDYFDFIRYAEIEMREFFEEVNIKNVGTNYAIYRCISKEAI